MYASGVIWCVPVYVVDKSVLASVGRALCFRFVGGAVVVSTATVVRGVHDGICRSRCVKLILILL